MGSAHLKLHPISILKSHRTLLIKPPEIVWFAIDYLQNYSIAMLPK
jgi:hypothetical protein